MKEFEVLPASAAIERIRMQQQSMASGMLIRNFVHLSASFVFAIEADCVRLEPVLD